MREKICVLVITLVTLLTSITIPQNIDVKASEEFGDPDLDHNYIFDIIEELTEIIEDNDYSERGRFFGELGEQYGADLILSWMNEIGLECVHNETINATWNQSDEGSDKSWYEGPLSQYRDIKDFYVNITVYWRSNNTLKEYKNLSFGESFPAYTISWKQEPFREDKGYERLFENYFPGIHCFELCDIHWLHPWNHFGRVDERLGDFGILCLGFFSYKGFIAIDNNTESFPMIPPVKDHKHRLGLGTKPGYYVNKTIGKWIRDSLHEKQGLLNKYKVYVKYYTYWEEEDAVSYNVIGQINGTDTNNVSIICAHYDSMWNQGSIDEAAGTAPVLGIAKLIKDYELESKLKHTVKFIAFGGEELGIRGARDYVKKHIIMESGEKENVTYVINPGNFGHHNRTGTNYYNQPYEDVGTINFTFYSFNSSMNNLAENITNALDYTPRTYTPEEGTIVLSKVDDWYPGEDSKIFCLPDNYYAKNCIEIDRFPNWQYHRDGHNHELGDTLEEVDNLTYHLECEAIASIAMHLLLDHNFSVVDYSNSTYDSDNDGDLDSVTIFFNVTSDTNISLFGNVTGCLYNTTTGEPVSRTNATGLIPFITGNNTAAHIDLTLYPNEPHDFYSAKLLLEDVFGNVHDEFNQTVNIKPFGDPVADFSWQVGVPPPKNITFSDNSLPSYGGTITSWNWSFDDGNYSTDQNPYHSYEFAGLYNVSLTITDSNNLTANVSKTVAVFDLYADVNFVKGKDVGKIGKDVKFESTSTDSDGKIINTTWYFGDGNIGYGTIVSHSYSKGGLYTITLEVTDNDGETNSTTDSIFIANEFADDSFGRNDSSEGNWTTIQAAVNNASDDDFIYVFNGTYNNITVDKEVALYGADRVIISGQQTGVDILCNNVTFEGFKIENSVTGIRLSRLSNSTISDCSVHNCTSGLKLESEADDNLVFDCDFINNTYGVFISNSINNFIGSPASIWNPVWDNCNFSLNQYGVYLSNSNNNFIISCDINALNSDPFSMILTSGIYIDNSQDNNVVCCDIYDANNYGIYMSGSSGNTVLYSYIRDNSKGIYLSGSSDNNIVDNNISGNTQSGVNILTLSSSSNSIFFNDFIDNGGLLYPQASDSGTGNNWNSTEGNTFLYAAAGEGNNWSDYTGSDSDGDGIGNSAYGIGGTANAEDSYPVMEEYGWFYKRQ